MSAQKHNLDSTWTLICLLRSQCQRNVNFTSIQDAGEAPLSAWGREDSRPGARRLGRALMPYEIVEPSRQEVAFFGRGEDGQLPKSETTEHPAVKNFATKFESCASRTAGAGVGGAKTGGQTASPPKKMFAHYAAKRAPPSRAAFGGFAAAPAGGASVPAQADSDEEEEEAKVARRFSNLIGGRRSNKFMPKPRNEQEDGSTGDVRSYRSLWNWMHVVDDDADQGNFFLADREMQVEW